MSEVQNLRAFKVTFLSPTNHRGARVKIVDVMTKRYRDASDAWSNMCHTVILPYSHRIGSIREQAIEHMQSVGLSIVAEAQMGDSEYIILSDSWNEDFCDLNGDPLYNHD